MKSYEFNMIWHGFHRGKQLREFGMPSMPRAASQTDRTTIALSAVSSIV